MVKRGSARLLWAAVILLAAVAGSAAQDDLRALEGAYRKP
jgi:hypothetical protein